MSASLSPELHVRYLHQIPLHAWYCSSANVKYAARIVIYYQKFTDCLLINCFLLEMIHISGTAISISVCVCVCERARVRVHVCVTV